MDEWGKENSFETLLQEQRELLQKYEVVLEAYEKSDMQKQNKRLKAELEVLMKDYTALKAEYDHLNKEVEGLRWTLREQLLSEKMRFVEKSEGKVEAYFESVTGELANRLKVTEIGLHRRLQQIKEMASKNLEDEEQDFLGEIESLKGRIHGAICQERANARFKLDDIDQEAQKSFEALKNQPLSEEIIQKRIKQNSMEAKIGLHWLNRLGVLLILVGLITVMRYSFTTYFLPEMKGVFGFVAGLLFLGGGELCYRRDKKVFSQGLIGGGIGILYLSLFSSYFILEIMNIPVAIALSLLVSVATFILSLRYNARAIATLGLIGGYLPVLAYGALDGGLSGGIVYIAMAYVLLLNGVTLLLAMEKEWHVLHIVSFFTYMPLLVTLVILGDSAIVSMLYTVVSFVLYTSILLVYPLRFQEKLSTIKVVMLGFNTFMSCVILWCLFVAAQWQDFMGLLATVFCLIYFALSQLIQKYTPKEKETQTVFSLTALTFAVLVMPLQFHLAYMSLGWMIEGVLLIVYGLRKEHKGLERGGQIILGICMASFLLIECYGMGIIRREPVMFFKHSVIVIGLIAVLLLYLLKAKSEEKQSGDEGYTMLGAYKYFVIANVWYYVFTLGERFLNHFGEGTGHLISVDATRVLWFAVVTVGMAYAMNHIEMLYDRKIKYVSLVLYGLVDVISIGQNFVPYTLVSGSRLLASIIVIVWNILVLLSVKRLLRLWVVKQNKPLEVYPFVLAVFLLGNTTVVLSCQFNIGVLSVAMSIIYIVGAFALIVCGFKYGYRWIRYSGLGLSVMAIGKLFLFDLTMGVDVMHKIISYFSFGIVLLGISYLYQKFSKRLEIEVQVKTEMEE